MRWKITASKRVHVSYIVEAPTRVEAAESFLRDDVAGTVDWEGMWCAGDGDTATVLEEGNAECDGR